MKPIPTRVRRQFDERADAVLPGLSPDFLSADDAARYVHALIDHTHAKECGGLILKAEDGKYVATLPFFTETDEYNPYRLLPVDETGKLSHPPGFICYALYHSHTNDYEPSPAKNDLREIAALYTRDSFFTPNDVFRNTDIATFISVHYLSGLNGSLIKYQSKGAEQDDALEDVMVEAMFKTTLFEVLTEQIRGAATLGKLSVIQSSEVWRGKVGRVGADFEVYTPSSYLDLAPRIVEHPAFGAVNPTLEEAIKDAKSRSHQSSERHYGVILQHLTRQEFIASEPVLGEVDFSLSRVFGAGAEGGVQLPHGYEVHGFYCASSLYHSPKRLPPRDRGLFKHFIDPEFLLAGIKAACSRTERPVPLYINAREGAVLRVMPDNNSVRRLSELIDESGAASPRYTRNNVLAGTVAMRDYICTVAATVQLSVIDATDMWGAVGRVDAHWQPYKHVTERDWSPAFRDADAVALHVHQHIKRESDRVFGGLICQRADGLFTATEPVASYSETFDPMSVYPAESPALMPEGYRVVAVYHSHRVQPLQLWRSAEEEQLYRNMLEPHELRAAIDERQWAQYRYFFGHDGALIKYTPSGSEREGRLMERITPRADQLECVRKNALQMKLRANALKPSEYISLVARSGSLQVLVGSPAWGEVGTVTSTWKVTVPRADPAAEKKPASPGL